MKLFDADPLVLQALSGSNIGVTVGIPNSMLKSFNSSKKVAESWVHDNVTRYFSSGSSGVRIEYVLLAKFPFVLILMGIVAYQFSIYGSLTVHGTGNACIYRMIYHNVRVWMGSGFC